MMKRPVKAVQEAYCRSRGYYAQTIAGMPLKVAPYHIPFWRKASRGRWENETFEILAKYLRPDATYVDIGAWIGPTVLYASRRCRRVICFEPDPAAYRLLRWNLELNNASNVTALNLGVSDRSQMVRMASFGGSAGDSMTSMINPDANNGFEALVLDWNLITAICPLEDVSLVKLDIEGGEFVVVPALCDWLRENQVPLYLSTHAPFLPAEERKSRMQALVDALSFYGTCRDESLKPIDRSDLTSDALLAEFGAYVFET